MRRFGSKGPRTFAGVVLSTALLLAGCRAFSHYVWLSGAADPEMDGTWTGRIVPVQLYDGSGKPVRALAAGLKISSGRMTYVQPSGMPALSPASIGHTPILTRDGEHAVLFSEFAPDTWVEVTGTLYPHGRYPLRVNDTWADQTPEPKNYHPDLYYPADTHGIEFLQISGALHPTTPPGSTTTAPAFTWGKEVDGFRLGISIAHTKVGGTQPVIVSVRLENVGKTARDLVFSGPLKGFQCEVSHAETKSQLTEYGKVFNPEPVVMSEPQRLRLEPGQKLALDICCSCICDMTISDKYSIIISRKIPSADGKSWTKVESATIEVEVADE